VESLIVDAGGGIKAVQSDLNVLNDCSVADGASNFLFQ
jgi:hypothetical protein